MKIMVPLDGSTLAEFAIGQAAYLARYAPQTHEIALVRVISLTALALSAAEINIAPVIAMAEEAANDYLREVTYRPSLAGLRVTTKTISTSLRTSDAICDAARTQQADLILVASHGRSGLGRALLGSVAREIVRASTIPTLIVQIRDQQHTPTSDRRLTILVPLDESPFAEQILPTVTAFAQATQGDVVLFDVLPTPTEDGFLDRDLRERAEAYLQRHVARLIQQGISARASLAFGDPATNIVQRAQHDTDPCDMIALATHALPAPERYFMGSVADEVARHAACPVLLTHPR